MQSACTTLSMVLCYTVSKRPGFRVPGGKNISYMQGETAGATLEGGAWHCTQVLNRKLSLRPGSAPGLLGPKAKHFLSEHPGIPR